MSTLTRLVLGAALMMMAACSTITSDDPAGPATGAAATWQLADLSIRFGPDIGRTATGEEFNSNFVWQGDGGGNRKRQVVSMFEEGVNRAASGLMTGERAVDLEVQINYFHALNNWARLFCCGAHRIYADLTVTDAGSGEVLAEGHNVALGRVALGGIPGLIAVAAGRTQRVRIIEGIAKHTRAWLAER